MEYYQDYFYGYNSPTPPQIEKIKNSEKLFKVICEIIIVITIIGILITSFSINMNPGDEEIEIANQYDIGITSLDNSNDIYISVQSKSQYPIHTKFWITGEYLTDGIFHDAGEKFTKLMTFNLNPGEVEFTREYFTDQYIYSGTIIIKEEAIFINPVDLSWLAIILMFAVALLNFQLTLEGSFEYMVDGLFYLIQEVALISIYTALVMWIMNIFTIPELHFFIFNIRIF